MTRRVIAALSTLLIKKNKIGKAMGDAANERSSDKNMSDLITAVSNNRNDHNQIY